MSERYPNGMHPNCAEPCPMCDMESVITAARAVLASWERGSWMDFSIDALRDAVAKFSGSEPVGKPGETS